MALSYQGIRGSLYEAQASNHVQSIANVFRMFPQCMSHPCLENKASWNKDDAVCCGSRRGRIMSRVTPGACKLRSKLTRQGRHVVHYISPIMGP